MKDLSAWRSEVDRMDRELVSLLNRRAAAVLGLAPLKRKAGHPVVEPSREREVLANVRAANRGPLADDALVRVFERVMDEMRAIQRGGKS